MYEIVVLNDEARADNNVDLQKFMIMPVGADSFHEGVRMNAEVFHALKGILKERGLSTGVGDEGGFAPDLKNSEEQLELMMEAVKKAEYKPNVDIVSALDPASNEFYEDGWKMMNERLGERIAKYDQLMHIEEFLDAQDYYQGKDILFSDTKIE